MIPGTIVPMDDADIVTKYPRRLLRRLLAAFGGFSEHDGSLMAAAMAYYFALSLFPLLLVLVAGLGVALRFTAAGQDAQDRLLVAIEQQVSPELSAQIGRALETVSENAASRGPIGFVVLLVTAIMIFTQVDHAFNRIWKLPDDERGGWKDWLWRLIFQRFKALLMLLAAGAFVLAATLTSLVWSAVQAAIQPTLELAPDDVRWVPGLLINVCLNFLRLHAGVPLCTTRSHLLGRGAPRSDPGRHTLGGWPPATGNLPDPPWLLDGLRRDRLVHRDHALGLLRNDRGVSRCRIHPRRARRESSRNVVTALFCRRGFLAATHFKIQHLDENAEAHREVDVPARNMLAQSFRYEDHADQKQKRER